jgi:hypothetical protein
MKKWIGAGLLGLLLAGCGGGGGGGSNGFLPIGNTLTSNAPASSAPARDTSTGSAPAGNAPAGGVPAGSEPVGSAPGSPSNPPTPNALFKVGAAVVNVDPTAPVYVGGYSDPSKPAIQTSNDPLQVRAFVVAKGNKAVAFAVVDSTGWFADYQEGGKGYGQFGARSDAANALAAHGFSVDRSQVMVSTTHSHATPTMVGIWGLMGPANQAYVKQVHDAVVAAVDQAASNLKTSELWFANGDINSIIWQNGQGTDHVDGFTVDARMPALWARDPDTGATNALYVSIPNHPDEFRPFNGSVTQGFSADVPGYVRKTMDDSVGGISVVGSGTLGRQESPGRDSTYAEVAHQGDYVTNALRLAMAKAQPLKSDALGGAETQIQVTVGSSQYNTGLLTLMKYNATSVGGPMCVPNQGCSIPRSLTAPWCVGNCVSPSGTGASTLGTYVTALRIGPLLYVSNPGESFAEVNDAIRSAVTDAQSVNVVGLAGDFLGYNWSGSDYTAVQFGSSDFAKYNVGPDLAQKTADAGYGNASSLGFQVTAAPVTVKAGANPTTPPVPTGILLPGIQFYASQNETAGSIINFYGSTPQPQVNYNKPNDVLSAIAWDFGDSKTGTSNDGDRLDHVFSSPGVYKVTATVTDANTGLSRSWVQSLRIDAPLQLGVSGTVDSKGNRNLSLTPTGGQGTLIAATWTCTNGSVMQGLTVTCPAGSGNVSVTAIDGAGNSATASMSVSQ